jgi:hypothetical protein
MSNGLEGINNIVSLDDAAQIIASTGDETVTILLGEPGIGKSTLRNQILAQLGWGKDQMVYLDAPLLDFPDFYMPDVVGGKTLKAYSEDWHLDSDKPQLYMIDEIGKMGGVTKPMITRLLCERTVSSQPIPQGSIMFATSNLSTDGVGDMFPAHMNNRVHTLRVKKPDADEVVKFSTTHGMNGTLIYFIGENPEVCASYTDLSAEELKANKYIFNPNTNTGAFCSNRSFWMASHTLNQMEAGKISRPQAMAHICGAIGAPATGELWATVELADSLPTRASIYTTPDKARVPDQMSSQLLLATRLASGLDIENADATTEYMVRLEVEIQACAGRMIFKSKPNIAMRSPAMRQWVTAFTKEFV